MRFLAEHALLFKLLTILLVVGLALLVVWIALPGKPRPVPDTARHRGQRRAWRVRPHTARHAAPTYHPHHAAVAPAPSAYLGRTPDGELALVDDEHTHELIGAAA